MTYRTITTLTLLLLATFGTSTFAAKNDRPNVLLILTDDQGWGDVHSHGNDQLDTPVLDQLASDGARFDRFFVSPVCAPTRASLLTGRYHLNTGTHGVTRSFETMRSEEVTIAEILKAAGYTTGCFGKWHNGRHYPEHPNGQGFDEFLGFCGGHHNVYFDTVLEHNGEKVQTTGYITDVLTDEALKFLRKNKDRPFFCYVPYNAPHAPFQVPDKYYDKYIKRGFEPKNAAVYGMCENLDENIGRLLKELDQLKLAQNTIVFFLTDNGPNTKRFNGIMRGRKGTVHEGGVRVPLFVRWPGHIQSGTMVQKPAAHFDLLPTIAELTGTPLPKNGLPLDGKSLVPLLKGHDKNWSERMVFNHWNGEPEVLPCNGAVRTDRYRLTYIGGRWELYDMIDDPSQKRNVNKEHPEVFAKLKKAYENWFGNVTRNGFDPMPAVIGHPKRTTSILPAHEAFLTKDADNQGIRYYGRHGWTGEYITNWTGTDAYPSWPIDVVQPGRYEVALLYNCSPENIGSKIRVEIGSQKVDAKVDRAFTSEPIPVVDRAPHPNQVEKHWAELPIGTLDLPVGKATLAVKVLDLAHDQVLDLKAVRLRKVE